MKNLYKVIAWAAMGVALAVTVWVTKNGWWLWFSVVPLLQSLKEEK